MVGLGDTVLDVLNQGNKEWFFDISLDALGKVENHRRSIDIWIRGFHQIISVELLNRLVDIGQIFTRHLYQKVSEICDARL